mmetsp:Transcript_20399/g.32874  ORF Transcript_20399/g.32874 Transcript_20399/m.32874 type:complete len:110 (+) Transcript_20399:48-377(+)
MFKLIVHLDMQACYGVVTYYPASSVELIIVWQLECSCKYNANCWHSAASSFHGVGGRGNDSCYGNSGFTDLSFFHGWLSDSFITMRRTRRWSSCRRRLILLMLFPLFFS